MFFTCTEESQLHPGHQNTHQPPRTQGGPRTRRPETVAGPTQPAGGGRRPTGGCRTGSPPWWRPSLQRQSHADLNGTFPLQVDASAVALVAVSAQGESEEERWSKEEWPWIWTWVHSVRTTAALPSGTFHYSSLSSP